MEAYWSKKRVGILKWLEDTAPALSGIYKIIIGLVYGAEQSVSTGLIASHGMREIMNGLPEYIAPASTIVGRVDYPMHCGRITPPWKAASLPIGTASAPTSLNEDGPKVEPPVVPQDLIFKIGHLVFDHESGAKRGPTNRAALFKALNEDYSTAMELLQPIMDEWASLAKWFVSKCHVNRLNFIPVPIEDLRAKIEQLESMLSVMSDNFFTVMEGLDEDIQQANS